MNDLLVKYKPKQISALTGLTASRITRYKQGAGAVYDDATIATIELHKRQKTSIARLREKETAKARELLAGLSGE